MATLWSVGSSFNSASCSEVIAENKEDPIKERQVNTKINFLLIFILLF
jgi:predicted nucleic acid-binding Zn ribbon protein